MVMKILAITRSPHRKGTSALMAGKIDRYRRKVEKI